MTQGPWGVLRTRLVDPMAGIRRRCGGQAVAAQRRRLKTALLGAGSRPVACIEGLAFDVLITSLRHFANRGG